MTRIVLLAALFLPYAQSQAAECIATLGAFRVDGDPVSITENGNPVTVDNWRVDQVCDRPPVLPDVSDGGEGQCIPGSRARVHQTQYGIDVVQNKIPSSSIDSRLLMSETKTLLGILRD